MSRTRSRATRAAVVSIALAGALGLSACQDDTTVSPPATTAAAPTSEAPSSEAPTTEATSEAPTTTETTSEAPSTTESSASTSAPAAGGDTTVTPKGTSLKIGQPGVVDAGGGTNEMIIKITPKSLTVAPDSVYTEANLNKANGTVYYVSFDATTLKIGSGAASVNGLFFHPKLGADNKGGKRLYGDTDQCKSDKTTMEQGESVSACYVYQIPGSTITDVEYNSHDSDITWTK